MKLFLSIDGQTYVNTGKSARSYSEANKICESYPSIALKSTWRLPSLRQGERILERKPINYFNLIELNQYIAHGSASHSYFPSHSYLWIDSSKVKLQNDVISLTDSVDRPLRTKLHPLVSRFIVIPQNEVFPSDTSVLHFKYEHQTLKESSCFLRRSDLIPVKYFDTILEVIKNAKLHSGVDDSTESLQQSIEVSELLDWETLQYLTEASVGNLEKKKSISNRNCLSHILVHLEVSNSIKNQIEQGFPVFCVKEKDLIIHTTFNDQDGEYWSTETLEIEKMDENDNSLFKTPPIPSDAQSPYASHNISSSLFPSKILPLSSKHWFSNYSSPGSVTPSKQTPLKPRNLEKHYNLEQSDL